MRRTVLAALTVAAVATTFTPALAAKPGLLDFACGFSDYQDPRPETSYSAQIGEIDAGPIMQNGTLTCTVKVDVAARRCRGPARTA
jgi:hypothetical protein